MSYEIKRAILKPNDIVIIKVSGSVSASQVKELAAEYSHSFKGCDVVIHGEDMEIGILGRD